MTHPALPPCFKLYFPTGLSRSSCTRITLDGLTLYIAAEDTNMYIKTLALTIS